MYGESCQGNIPMPANGMSGGMTIKREDVIMNDTLFDRVVNARHTSDRIKEIVESINGKLFGPSSACDEQCPPPAPCIEYVVYEINDNLIRIEKALADISNRL